MSLPLSKTVRLLLLHEKATQGVLRVYFLRAFLFKIKKHLGGFILWLEFAVLKSSQVRLVTFENI